MTSKVSSLAINLISSPYELSKNWEKMHGILITAAIKRFKVEVIGLLNHFKLFHVMKMIDENLVKLKSAKSEKEENALLETHQQLLGYQLQLADLLGTVILR